MGVRSSAIIILITAYGDIELAVKAMKEGATDFIQKPYDDIDAYRSDILDRYQNGEFTNQDSIKFPDSLIHKTLITKRDVYSGGGIMPDYFVGLDTTENSSLYSHLIRAGHLNNYSFSYVNKKRDELMGRYSSFQDFKKNFNVDDNFMNDFFEYLSKEEPEFVVDEDQLKTSDHLLKLRIKAMLAQDLWGLNELYEIFNNSNEIILKAVNVAESNIYDKSNLSKRN